MKVNPERNELEMTAKGLFLKEINVKSEAQAPIDVDEETLNVLVSTKLYESELFLKAADNNLRKIEVIKKHLTVDDKKRIIAANLEVGYHDEILEDKMDFINRLPYECKVELTESILEKLTSRGDAEEVNETGVI